MSNDPQSRVLVALIAHALADPRRYAMLEQIAGAAAPVSVAALRQQHDIGAPTMSHHLRILAEAGLIEVTRQGKRMAVSLRPDIVAGYLRDVGYQLRLI